MIEQKTNNTRLFMKPTLLVLAAGMGSRYGGLKQMVVISSDLAIYHSCISALLDIISPACAGARPPEDVDTAMLSLTAQFLMALCSAAD